MLAPYSGGRTSTAGGTGELPVCSAKWWAGRFDTVSPVAMALPKTIRPIATTPAISTISIWIAMVINPLALLLSAKHIGMESADRHARQDMF
jgi:hypothetical protein